MGTVTKRDLIEKVSKSTGIHRNDVKRTIQDFLDQIVEHIGQGHRLEFRDFGVFEIRERAPRSAQNPKTLEPVRVPARRTIKFKVGRKMRDALDGTTGAGEVPMIEVRHTNAGVTNPGSSNHSA